MEHFEENQAQLREKLIGELIGLARATEGNEHMLTPTTAAAVVEGLAAALPGGCCDAEVLSAILDRVDREKRKLVPACYSCTASCGRNDAYDMRKLQNLPEHIREMKLRLLAGIQELAAHSCRTLPGDREASGFFYRALFAIGMDDWEEAELLPILGELQEKT